jgi:F0F1-type ATP synthase epsilon subunit
MTDKEFELVETLQRAVKILYEVVSRRQTFDEREMAKAARLSEELRFERTETAMRAQAATENARNALPVATDPAAPAGKPRKKGYWEKK